MKAAFQPSGVITLTTDIGHQGPFVASMKGRMLTRLPGVNVVDLTHNILVHWPAEAGFWLERCYHHFPTGTVHLAVVDPGVGTERDIVVALVEGHAFLAPDNGLLAPMLGRHPDAVIRHLDLERLSQWGIDRVSATFHGRDIFAPLAAELAAGRCHPEDLGPPATDLIPSWVDEPEIKGERVKGLVVTVDNFGNLITNIDAALIDGWTDAVVHVGGRVLPLKRTYGDMKPGDFLALINSYDVLEIAQAESSASEGLSLERGAPVDVRRRPGVPGTIDIGEPEHTA